ncbi:epoxide hydrolase family protein [Actinomadura kijaniata]|uniref:epoxide hydrolase family protein n=1 Tax=Actinomadura kijaniata TaxID=46161 RepID=UPI000832D101|nr:epoxide hydrolase family protein [Actinomadura kijaniata]
MSSEITPFRIDIPQADLDDLRDRLARTRWARRLPGGDWDRGVPTDHLHRMAEYWRTGYDWRRHEAELNRLPQYTTEIDGQTIHFLHVRSPEPDAVPLVLTHSWPNSIAEFTRVIGPLTDPRAHGGDGPAFHVVAPSLPGFAFSPFPEPPDERPWSIDRVARTWAELMERLGYDRYGAHGNDAGALVTPRLAALFPDRVTGAHITAGLGFPTGDPAESEGLTEEEKAELAAMAGVMDFPSGYGPYLAGSPQTLAHAFADSPVFQLAYLVERFREFDRGHGTDKPLEEYLDLDQFLTNATLYWLTGTGGSSSWTYYEGAAGMPVDQAEVPTGVSHGGPPLFRRLAERGNRIIQWSGRASASHMVAMADPEGLVEDVRTFFARLS